MYGDILRTLVQFIQHPWHAEQMWSYDSLNRYSYVVTQQSSNQSCSSGIQPVTPWEDGRRVSVRCGPSLGELGSSCSNRREGLLKQWGDGVSCVSCGEVRKSESQQLKTLKLVGSVVLTTCPGHQRLLKVLELVASVVVSICQQLDNCTLVPSIVERTS